MNLRERIREGIREGIREAINCASAENGSNTPDFILAEYLTDCLAAFDKAVTRRLAWYKNEDEFELQREENNDENDPT